MNNKTVKISIVLLILVVIFSFLLYYFLFIDGKKSYDNVVIDKVTISKNEMLLVGKITDSSRAFKEYDYYIKENDVYVTIKSVLVSNKYNDGEFQLKIPVSGVSVKRIYLVSGDKKKSIYNN